MTSPRKTLDAGSDYAPDFDGLVALGDDVGVSGIASFEAHDATCLVQILHRELAINDSHHDVTMARLNGAVNNNQIAIGNAVLLH